MAGIKRIRKKTAVVCVLCISAVAAVLFSGCENPIQDYIGTYLYRPAYNLEVSKLKIEGAVNYGHSVDISGDYIIVGAPAEWDNTANDEAVYIYHRTDIDTWDEGFKLKPADWKAGDNFGYSVSIYGDYAAVGAPYKQVDDTGGITRDAAGAIYIYKRTGTNVWELDSELTQANFWAESHGYDAVEYALFGYSVKIYGSWLFIGASQDDLGKAKGDDYGAVYAFKYSSGWVFKKRLTADVNEKLNAHFGFSIDANADYIAVGAPMEEINGSYRVGTVYIFNFLVDGWENKERITANDGKEMDYFGVSVAVSDDFVTAGTYQKTVEGKPFAGKVYVYAKSQTGSFNTEPAELTLAEPHENDMYGFPVAIHGDTLIVGSIFRDKRDSGDTGAAFLYKNTSGINSWELQKTLTPSDAAANMYFGKSIAIGGDYTIIGACHAYEYTENGSAYIFR